MATDTECLTYTVEEIGKKLGIGRNAAYAACKRGDVPGSMKIGGSVRVSKIVFDKWLDGKLIDG